MPATIDSMTTGYMERYSQLQGRYWHRAEFPDEPAGNTYMLMRRNTQKPNQAMQLIRNLKPGELYSVKMISADYSDIGAGVSAEKRLNVAVNITDAEVVEERSFQATYSCQAWEPFKDKPAWFNLHRVVFEAKDEHASLVITDWPDGVPATDDGGDEIMINFIEVQPYYEPAA
jgi:hypothetical protein